MDTHIMEEDYMALITCPECGRQISDRASVCIGCGIPMEEIIRILNAKEKPVQTNVIDRQIRCLSCGLHYNASEFKCPKCKCNVKIDITNAVTEDGEVFRCPKCGYYFRYVEK